METRQSSKRIDQQRTSNQMEQQQEAIHDMDSADTITNEENDGSQELFTPAISMTNQRAEQHRASFSVYDNPSQTPERVALSIDRLNDKRIRYESHLSFLTKCADEQLIPYNFRSDFDPSIGNRNEKFMEEVNKIKLRYSQDLMKLTTNFCKDTVKETRESLHSDDEKLKEMLPENKYKEVREEIVKKGQSTTNYLLRKKTHKLNKLKYGTPQRRFNNNNNYEREFPTLQPTKQNLRYNQEKRINHNYGAKQETDDFRLRRSESFKSKNQQQANTNRYPRSTQYERQRQPQGPFNNRYERNKPVNRFDTLRSIIEPPNHISNEQEPRNIQQPQNEDTRINNEPILERVVSFTTNTEATDSANNNRRWETINTNKTFNRTIPRYERGRETSKNLNGAPLQMDGGADQMNSMMDGLHQAFDAIYELEEQLENKLDQRFDQLLAQLTTRFERS